jgi:hypothetical protein
MNYDKFLDKSDYYSVLTNYEYLLLIFKIKIKI